MKKNRQLFQFFFLSLLVVFSIFSCSADESLQNNNGTINLKSRAIHQDSYPQMYHHKTIASYAKGESIGEPPKALEGRKISIAVVYDSDAPWAEIFSSGKLNQTDSYKFNQILDANKMIIHDQFQIDGYNECLILDLNITLEDVATVCKSISLIDYVLVVNIKEWPSVKKPAKTNVTG